MTQPRHVPDRMPDGLSKTWGGFPAWFWALLGLLTLAQLWLAAYHAFPAMMSPNDDEMYLTLGRNIAAGQWLGPYNENTLLKQPFYPIWIACMFVLSIPLSISEHLLYVASCAACVVALRPLMRGNALLSGFIYLTLLFHPVAAPPLVGTRVLREAIYPALTLLTMSCAIGVYLRRAQPLGILLRWNIALGLALAAFWLTREEGVWLAPAVGLLLLATAAAFTPLSRASLKPLLALCIAPVMTTFLVLLICTANQLHYGVFTTTEQLQSDFTGAVAALQQVKAERFTQYLDVPKEKRERIYAVSPAFAELRPYLDREPHNALVMFGAHAGKDISKSHFQFALRGAVFEAGHYTSGERAKLYYRRLTAEINAACDNGTLQRDTAGQLPFLKAAYLGDLLRPELSGAFARTYARVFASAVVFPTLIAGRQEVRNTPDVIRAVFKDITRDRIANDCLYLSAQTKVDDVKIRILHFMFPVYQVLSLLLFIPAVALFLFDAVRLARRHTARRADAVGLVIMAALLLALLARTAVVTLMTVTVDPTFADSCLYQMAMLPLVSLFSLVSLARRLPQPVR